VYNAGRFKIIVEKKRNNCFETTIS